MQNEHYFLWGHSLSQYQRMFDLTPNDLNKKILDCASGFASFNQEMTTAGSQVISCDPAYDFPLPQLKKHLEIGLNNLLSDLKKHPSQLIFQENAETTISEIAEQNQGMIERFLQDFPVGKDTRYIAATLPKLPWAENKFELALCAYFLFSNPQFSQKFQLDSIQAMCKVAGEARIYPILDHTGNVATQLPPIILQLQQMNYGVEIKQVNYEVQKGGNAMLRVWRQDCLL